MTELISEKLKAISEHGPGSAELRQWIDQSSVWYWLWSVFNVQGEPVGKRDIVMVLEGGLCESIPLNLHSFMHDYSAVYRDMKLSLTMDQALDPKTLDRWYEMLCGKKEHIYRMNNPIVYEWELIPVHFRDIKREYEAAVRNVLHVRVENEVERAARMCLEISRVYPYGPDTAVMSLLAAQYVLLAAGIPFPRLTAGDVDYNKLISAYAEEGDCGGLISMFERSVLNRLEEVLQYTIEAENLNAGKGSDN